MLVAPESTDVVAKALTHGTAKWAWLARRAGPGVHVVRLSYGRAGAVVEEPDVAQALRDASRLLGVELGAGQLRGHATVRWTQALPRPSGAHREVVEAVRSAVAELAAWPSAGRGWPATASRRWCRTPQAAARSVL